MTQEKRDLAWKILNYLNEKGAGLGNASVLLIEKVLLEELEVPVAGVTDEVKKNIGSLLDEIWDRDLSKDRVNEFVNFIGQELDKLSVTGNKPLKTDAKAIDALRELRKQTWDLMTWCEDQQFMNFSDDHIDGIKELNAAIKKAEETIIEYNSTPIDPLDKELKTEDEWIEHFRKKGFELYKTEDLKPKLDQYYKTVDRDKEELLKQAKEIIQMLKAFGMIHTVTGVVYPEGSHNDFIEKAQNWIEEYLRL